MVIRNENAYSAYLPPKHILSAAAIILNEQGELLLIKGPRREWEMPG